MHRQYLLLAAAAASTVGASHVPRDDVSSVPQTRGLADDVRYGALMGAPAPTPAPKPPRFAAMALLEQREEVGPNTCGYFTNNGAWDWYTCANTNAVCTNSGTIRQCCHSTECSTTTFGSQCLDYSSCDSTRNPATYCCTYTPSLPYCTSFLWSSEPTETFTFFGCGEDSTSRIQVLHASTEGVNEDISSVTSGTSTRGNAAPDPDQTSTDKPSSTSGTPQTTTADSDGGGAPVGAIVGGVVGGLAVIALLALGIFFLLRRNRNNNNNANPNNPNNPAAQPFMATHHQPPVMHNAMGAPQGPHSPSAYHSIGYAGASPSPYTQHSSPFVPGANPHQSVYSASGLSPQPTGVTNSPPQMGHNGWAAGAPPPPQSPPPSWGPPQYPQGAPVVGWNTGSSGEAPKNVGEAGPPQGNVQELPSMNPVGQYGGNNRAELG